MSPIVRRWLDLLKLPFIRLDELFQEGLEQRVRPIRDVLCFQLHNLGIDVCISEGHGPEPTCGRMPRRFVEIRNSPIQWADILQYMGPGDDPFVWVIKYLVPDPRLLLKVEVLSRLTSALFLPERITDIMTSTGDELKIDTDREKGYWAILIVNKKEQFNSSHNPILVTRERWSYYVEIANYLLSESLNLR